MLQKLNGLFILAQLQRVEYFLIISNLSQYFQNNLTEKCMWVYIGTKFVNGTYLFRMIDCDYADLSHEGMFRYCKVTTYRNPLTPKIILCQSPPVLPSIGGMRDIKKTCVRCNKNPVFTRNICHELSGEDLGKRHL